MPSLWKKPFSCAAAGGVALSRFVTGHRGGSFPVKTGFPTSLADLVVKNRNRFKKHSRKKKPSADTVSCSYRPSAAAAAPASSSLNPPEAGTFARISRVEHRGVPVVVQNGFGSVVRRDAEIRLPTPEIPAASEKSGFRIGIRMGFMVVFVILSILMILVIERKTLVAGITVFALGLWLLDYLGVKVFGFLKPRSDTQSSSNSVLQGTDLEKKPRVSLIRESDNSSNSILHERSSVEPIHLHQGKNLMPESRDLIRTGVACVDQAPSSSKSGKPKRLFKKLIAKRLRRRTNDKAQCEPSSCPTRRKLLADFLAEEAKEIQEIEECAKSSEEPVLNFTASDRCVNFDIGNSKAAQEHTYKTKPIGSGHLFFLALILLGLLEGKITALILAVSWVVFSKRLQNMWKKRVAIVF